MPGLAEWIIKLFRDDRLSLIAAARSGKTADVAAFLDRGLDVDTSDANGLTLLTLAAGRGHSAVVKLLLDRGADIGRKEKRKGLSALKFAAGKGIMENVVLLIERGADLNVKDVYRNTAVTVAEDMGHAEIRQYLLDNGAQPMERFYLG